MGLMDIPVSSKVTLKMDSRKLFAGDHFKFSLYFLFATIDPSVES